MTLGKTLIIKQQPKKKNQQHSQERLKIKENEALKFNN